MYRSPIRLTGFTGLQQEQASLRSALLLARRRMEAEFDLADSSTVTFEGQELNRQDVVDLFDELKDERRLSWHLAIYEDKVLLRFLEEGRLYAHEHWASHPLYEDPDFLAFVSPYFAAAIDAFYRRLLNGESSLEALHTLAGNDSLLLSRDSEKAFRFVTRYFLEKKNELFRFQQRAAEGERLSRKAVRDMVTDEDLSVLNYLPGSYDDLRYQIANTLNNICVIFDQKSRNRHALIAVEKAARVSVTDEELQTLIPGNLSIIRSKQPGSWYKINEDGRRQPKWGLIAVVAIALLRVAGYLFGDSGSYRGSDEVIRRYADHVRINQTLDREAEPLRTFGSLLWSATGPDADPSVFRMTGVTFDVPEPQGTGDAVFQDVLSTEFRDNLDSTGLLEARKRKSLSIRNNSGWHLLLAYAYNEQEFHVQHIAPLDSYKVHYVSEDFRAWVLAGKAWSRHRRYLYNSYPGSHGITATRGVVGGYKHQPVNMRQYMDPEATPLLVRTATFGQQFTDRIVVADSAAGAISVRVEKGEPVLP